MRLSEVRKILFFLLVSIHSLAQFSKPEEPRSPSTTESEKYLFPINPGSPNLLAGTMGELRSTHFHAGIDIRTNNKTGIPVRATQDGYISRASVSSFGYGRVLFVTHPDGNTSVYGHLDQFKGSLANHVLKEQYRKKSFDIDLFFSPSQFPVAKGDTIALSGNTGGSSGPHLHFEIRNAKNEALNPLQFNFNEITDQLAPIGQKIALKTMDEHSRINDQFGRFEFSLIKSGNDYLLPSPILAHGKIGIELLAFDKLEPGPFRCGINYIEMRVDGVKKFSQVIEKINFEETRGILALMDYKTMKMKGARYNKMYVDDGNKLSYYEDVQQQGIVDVGTAERKIELKLRDTYGNVSSVSFTLKPSATSSNVILLEDNKKDIDFSILENTLTLSVKRGTDTTSSVQFFSKGKITTRFPHYGNSTKSVYLLDLRTLLPDSVKTSKGTLPFSFVGAIPSGTEYTYYSDAVDIEFPEMALYDTLFLTLRLPKDSSLNYVIGNSFTPLHKTVAITLKEVHTAFDRKTAVYRSDNNRFSYLGGEWRNDQVRFFTRELGNFSILKDSIPPSITKVYAHSAGVRFRIRDNLSGISYFEATLNGQWLLMNYDYKTGLLQSEKLDRSLPLKGELVLRVVDNAGNEKIFQQKIL